MNLEQIQSLLALVDRFKTVKRTILNVGQESQENDAEHSYELAIFCWLLAIDSAKNGINLDLEKVFKYAISHDLVEAYAGDTDAFDTIAIETKHLREEEALKRLKDEFSFFPDLIDSIAAYENQSDIESVFVKSVDKIQPVLANVRDHGRSWKRHHPTLTLDGLSEQKESKIKDKQIFDIWKLIKEDIRTKGYLK